MLDFNAVSKITGATLEDHIQNAAVVHRGILCRHGFEVAEREINKCADTIARYFDIDGDEVFRAIARRITDMIFRPDIEI